jgi:Spy/CpxP family protein refolding chaperone
MMDLPTAENIKHPKLALIAGLLIGLSLGAGAAWTTSTNIHDAQFKVLDAVNRDLQRQVSELQESSQAKDDEMAHLREQLSEISPQRQEVEVKRRRELEAFIQRVDREITQKKKELAALRSATYMRPSLSFPPSSEKLNSQPPAPPAPCTNSTPYTPVIRLEKELDSLAMQREEARKRLIGLTAR